MERTNDLHATASKAAIVNNANAYSKRGKTEPKSHVPRNALVLKPVAEPSEENHKRNLDAPQTSVGKKICDQIFSYKSFDTHEKVWRYLRKLVCGLFLQSATLISGLTAP